MIHEYDVVIDGLRTRYLETGDRSRPTILLIHDGGFGGSADVSWSEVMGHLADHFHVVAPDMLGWGGSAKVVHFDEPPYPSKIRHIGRLVEYLDLRDVVVAGSSFGGSIVLRAAIADGNPWRMKAAVSITGAGGLYRTAEGVEAISTYETTIEDARRLTSWLVEDAGEFEDHAKARLEASLLPGHWEAMNAPRIRNPHAEKVWFDDPFPDALGNLTIPVLLIEGSRDRLLEPGWAEKLGASIAHGEVLVLDCGHEPNIEIPAETAEVLAEFALRSIAS